MIVFLLGNRGDQSRVAHRKSNSVVTFRNAISCSYCNCLPEEDHARRLRRRGLVISGSVVYLPCFAWSAACASPAIYAKNAGDWPMKSPMFVRNCSAPVATPSVLVGRMIETIGRLVSRNGHGSGMIRFFFRSGSLTSRSGNVTETPVTGSTAVKGGALPA